MGDPIEQGAICGTDDCSTSPAIVTETKNRGDARSVHDLTIVSDVICPWCFIGKKHIEKALELAGNDLAVKIAWRPFELNPGMPKEGADRRAFRTRKFGSWEQSLHLDAQVREAGKAAGLTFRHDLMERTPNTLDAHRLIWLAQKVGAQDAVVESLFQAYFTQGRDVGDRATLIEVATHAGIAEGAARATLESAEGMEEVRREEQSAIAAGISGVPTFILDGITVFSGALKPIVMAGQLIAAASLSQQ